LNPQYTVTSRSRLILQVYPLTMGRLLTTLIDRMLGPNLMEWVAQRTYGNSSPYMGRVASKNIRSYLAAIRSTHIDRILPVAVFENPSLRRMLDGATSLNPSLKEATQKLPISRSILTKIATGSSSIPGVNTDAAFCLAFAGCLRMGEISYTDKQRSEPSFAATKATRSDKHPSLVWEAWSGKPGLVWEAPFAAPSQVARAAAANVNPRTRLSHMTLFSGRDWCTRERCRPMMQKSQIFPEFPADDSQNLRRAREFPRIFPGLSDKVRRRRTPPPPTTPHLH
jgi:hypothetical protein